ncbi:MAG: methylamine utilization protein MauJ [bacterium]
MKPATDAPGAFEVANQEVRPFEVTCILSRQPVLAFEALNFKVDAEAGDSFLRYPPGATESSLHTSLGSVRLVPNREGRLSTVTGTISAKSFHESCVIFTGAIAPFLDHVSYALNVPVTITKTLCVDQKSGARWMSLVTPYRDGVMEEESGELHRQMLPVYALYREAKNATSSYYRFLCYYKILEGIYTDLRPNLFNATKSAGVRLETRKELVPRHPELEKDWPEYIGEPIKAMFDGLLRERFRNSVAHAVTDERGWLTLSELTTDYRFGGVLTLIELCVREVVDTHVTYLDELARRQ